MAILVAGSIQLLRLSRSDNTVEIGRVGTAAAVDRVEVTLVERPEADRVLVRVAVDPDRDALDDVAAPWAVRVGATRFPAVPTAFDDGPPDCAEVSRIDAGTSTECQLRFVTSGEGTHYLQFTLSGTTAVWTLDG